MLFDRVKTQEKSVYRIFTSEIGSLSFGPYDNGPIIITQSPSIVVGLSTIDLAMMYKIDLSSNIRNIKPSNISMLAFEPA